MAVVGHAIFKNEPDFKRLRYDVDDTNILAFSNLTESDLRASLTQYAKKQLLTSPTKVSEADISEFLEVQLEEGQGGFSVVFSFTKGGIEAARGSSSAPSTSLPSLSLSFPTFLHCESSGKTVHVFRQSLPTKEVPCTRAEINTPVLLVGVGGIGCEVLKLLVLEGYREIHIIDLDTVDATNLNRQFLFTSESVGHPKSLVSRQSVLSWFQASPPSIVAYHDNIKDSKFDDQFFSQFGAVVNALDNVAARQHVNIMCMRNRIPLIESGTMGYNGQTYSIIRQQTECYHCQPKPPDKQTFAVCTIHARPTNMVHCVHYAKELYEMLFGDSNGEDGNAGEYKRITDVVQEAKSQPSWGSDVDFIQLGKQLLVTMFHQHILELLDMKTTWPTGAPTALQREWIEGLPPILMTDEALSSALSSHETVSFSTLENLNLCLYSMVTLFKRERTPFKKEDLPTIIFVSSIANLRAEVFGLPNQPLEEIRSIAGSIVPAIATTNAIIASGAVYELNHILSRKDDVPLYTIYARKTPQVRKSKRSTTDLIFNSPQKVSSKVDRRFYLVHTAPTAPPNPKCRVCQDLVPSVRVGLGCAHHLMTVREFVNEILGAKLNFEFVSVSMASSIIYEEEDYEVMGDTTLQSLCRGESKSIELQVSGDNHSCEWVVRVCFQDTEGIVVEGLERALEVEKRAASLLHEVEEHKTPNVGDTDSILTISDDSSEEIIEID